MNTIPTKIYKAGSVLLILLSFYVVVLAINAIKANKYIGGDIISSNIITVSGEGDAFAVPDVAQFTYSVFEEKITVEEAQEAVAEKANAIQEYLEEQGIEERDIKTVNYNVNPQYDYVQREVVCVRFPCPQPPGEQVLRGYGVNTSVQVKVRDTEEAGTLLSGVGERGATNISGLSFMIDDPEELQREARKMAIEDAQEKAEQLADDLGVDLVRIVNFYEDGPVPHYPYDGFARKEMALDVADEAVVQNIALGENQVSVNVNITYEIK